MITEKTKELLKALSLSEVTDFVSDEYVDDYLEETNYSKEEVLHLCSEYDGWGISSITDSIISELRKNL